MISNTVAKECNEGCNVENYFITMMDCFELIFAVHETMFSTLILAFFLLISAFANFGSANAVASEENESQIKQVTVISSECKFEYCLEWLWALKPHFLAIDRMIKRQICRSNHAFLALCHLLLVGLLAYPRQEYHHLEISPIMGSLAAYSAYDFKLDMMTNSQRAKSAIFSDFTIKLILVLVLLAAWHSTAQAMKLKDGINYTAGLKLDVYQPDRSGGLFSRKKPVVIYIHGGGWAKGSRKRVYKMPQWLTSKGYIFVAMDYRKVPGTSIDGQVRDVTAAVAWARRNIRKYGGDPNRMVLMGHSAGAHLSALVAAQGQSKCQAGREPWYERKTEMRNERQLTLVAHDELSLAAKEMGLDKIAPEWIGANLVINGIPNLSFLPASTLLFFEGGVTLKIDFQNAPCRSAGSAIARNLGRDGDVDLALKFKDAAKRRRGLTAWVEKPGTISVGEKVTARIPEQWIYA
ncbi:putative metal-sulfur cluster biosynthesis proteins YuaD [Nymphon striatum]|nr:putative metal-sulfur cluster biosynthesis proteins YuaD [Nymphon striatum]